MRSVPFPPGAVIGTDRTAPLDLVIGSGEARMPMENTTVTLRDRAVAGAERVPTTPLHGSRLQAPTLFRPDR